MSKVLIVEDDCDIRDMIQTSLERDGFEVHQAVDGDDGWEKLNAERYDIAVVDRMMPGRSGIELIAACRADRSLHELPIIMLTAKALDAEVEEGMDAGATVYLTKPFSLAGLANLIATTLGSFPSE